MVKRPAASRSPAPPLGGPERKGGANRNRPQATPTAAKPKDNLTLRMGWTLVAAIGRVHSRRRALLRQNETSGAEPTGPSVRRRFWRERSGRPRDGAPRSRARAGEASPTAASGRCPIDRRRFRRATAQPSFARYDWLLMRAFGSGGSGCRRAAPQDRRGLRRRAFRSPSRRRAALLCSCRKSPSRRRAAEAG